LRRLAARSELSPSTISALERGKVTPSVRAAWRLAAVLGVTVDDLLKRPPALERTKPKKKEEG
jgi:transcriptional regulator with XRE-family HTH domain